ncbi:adenylate kinase family protein [Luteolibacter algae]|uniref:Adenylate kinase n=1 Tax=Luteolibacter algae TaxID=454151 RepID=A0ABW5D2J8_9BACT
MRLVLLGPPASGKGTQGRFLAKELGLDYLSTGALLRESIENGTELGIAAKPILARGGYLPDELMQPLIVAWLEENNSSEGWILDGFPRSLAQAEFLEEWMASHNSALDAAISLEVPFEELLKRIVERVECPDCRWTGQERELSAQNRCPECGGMASSRADDDEANFRNRFAEFEQLTLPAIDYYSKRGKLIRVLSSAPKESVSRTLLNSVFRSTETA